MTLKERASNIRFRLKALPVKEADRIEREWNLSVPLATMIEYGLIAGLTPDGEAALSELEDELTAYEA